jgi:hypothetical protein
MAEGAERNILTSGFSWFSFDNDSVEFPLDNRIDINRYIHPFSGLPSSMASSDPIGLYIFDFILLLIVSIFACAYLNNRITTNKRKQPKMALRASPIIKKDAPVLV